MNAVTETRTYWRWDQLKQKFVKELEESEVTEEAQSPSEPVFPTEDEYYEEYYYRDPQFCISCSGGGLKWYQELGDVDVCDRCGGCGVC